MELYTILYLILMGVVAFKLLYASFEASLAWGYYRPQTTRTYTSLMTGWSFARHFGVVAFLSCLYLSLPLVIAPTFA